ncbi:hypothetical protein NHX12_009079 [Muraenolepis orangiensis]|uniref:Peptidase metallopeptidase domain-containing protein n=1 Tax=Muraenolepis orangiensis TaxID=630683 RepID=A0A9Q0I8N0_9TELE|nr:hypothetical protein NHX12_009079 [Muraenolepis orangiensis]
MRTLPLCAGFFCALVLVLPAPCGGTPTTSPETQETASEPQHRHADRYLEQHYNLNRDALMGRERRSLESSFVSEVQEMQTFFGLNATGVLDPETLEVMRSPRCGVPDVEDYSLNQGPRWAKSVITYNIGRYTRDLPRGTVDSLVASALGVWARASGLTFVRLYVPTADIMVEFVSREHGDLYPFDGPRGTLAHAFGPGSGMGGDTHFDDDEHWTAGGKGFNLYLVAAHEFGHALGLKHSRNPQSLMYPTYTHFRRADPLSAEDVANINALYGPSRSLPQHFSRDAWSPQYNPWLAALFPQRMQNRCSPGLAFDAVTVLGDGTCFFRERYLWMKHNVHADIKEGPITNFMPRIESGIDAAFWVPRRSTAYLIHESMFWTVKGSRVRGKPRPLSHFGLPVWVQDVDAAVHIPRTSRTLFFIHDLYWSYNENRRIMDNGYPKYISDDFPGLNATIHAAIHKEEEGCIFFFVGAEVYQYDYTQRGVVGVEKANTWLGC